MNAISDYCIYTIVHGDRLLLGARNAGPAVFHQTKAWITGYRLWLNAEADGLLMPVLLADSTDCSKLLYWGVLTSVSLADGGTTFTVDRLRRLR
ncbi:MAG: hypothetical protein WBK46_12125, partial [Ruminococcus flavefaciens]